MKRYLAMYIGSAAAREKSGWDRLDEATRKAREALGIRAWKEWMTAHADSVVEYGAPLGKTKRVAGDGISDTKNNLAGYTVVQAESYEEAAKLFDNHPHFAIFPGEAVEIMECLPIPGM